MLALKGKMMTTIEIKLYSKNLREVVEKKFRELNLSPSGKRIGSSIYIEEDIPIELVVNWDKVACDKLQNDQSFLTVLFELLNREVDVAVKEIAAANFEASKMLRHVKQKRTSDNQRIFDKSAVAKNIEFLRGKMAEAVRLSVDRLKQRMEKIANDRFELWRADRKLARWAKLKFTGKLAVKLGGAGIAVAGTVGAAAGGAVPIAIANAHLAIKGIASAIQDGIRKHRDIAKTLIGIQQQIANLQNNSRFGTLNEGEVGNKFRAAISGVDVGTISSLEADFGEFERKVATIKKESRDYSNHLVSAIESNSQLYNDLVLFAQMKKKVSKDHVESKFNAGDIATLSAVPDERLVEFQQATKQFELDYLDGKWLADFNKSIAMYDAARQEITAAIADLKAKISIATRVFRSVVGALEIAESFGANVAGLPGAVQGGGQGIGQAYDLVITGLTYVYDVKDSLSFEWDSVEEYAAN